MATPEKHAYRRLWWARARVMVYRDGIIFIYAEAPRLIVFAVIMLSGAGGHLTPRLHLPTDLKLISANIVNIVSLNSCHSRIIRNDERRGSQLERCRNRMAYQK